MSYYQRSELALELEEIFKEKAKENKAKAIEKARKQNPNNKDEQFLSNVTETVDPINTREELSKIAGVSTGTIYKSKVIKEQGDDETKGI